MIDLYPNQIVIVARATPADSAVYVWGHKVQGIRAIWASGSSKSTLLDISINLTTIPVPAPPVDAVELYPDQLTLDLRGTPSAPQVARIFHGNRQLALVDGFDFILNSEGPSTEVILRWFPGMSPEALADLSPETRETHLETLRGLATLPWVQVHSPLKVP